MRIMSFHLTSDQIRDRSKTVTRRLGWLNLSVGDELLAVEKSRGVRREDRVELARLVVVELDREKLSDITKDDVVREGFPEMSREDFITMFCKSIRCQPGDYVTRIRFRYVEEGQS